MLIVGALLAISGLAMWGYSWYVHRLSLRDQARWMQERADRERGLREMAEQLKKGEADAVDRIRSAKEAADRQVVEHRSRLQLQGIEEQSRWMEARAARDRELTEKADDLTRYEADVNERVRLAQQAADRKLAATREVLTLHEVEVTERIRLTKAAAELELAQTRQAAEAVRNLIEGYGNRHLIPVASLIDDLADAADYSDPGRKLKQARTTTRRLIKDGRAAVCDNSDTAGSQQRIELVLSVFQGTTEAVISDVQNANYGQAAQRIRDAFALANYHGRSCENTRITEEFLETRLEELKWAAIARDLLRQEREQQKRLREAAREEERARREAAEAAERAAKEQSMIERAILKAKEQAEHASAEQRGKYESQMLELQQRLKDAEERNQRAKSMAEQTRRGHVYVISNVGSFGDGVYKIGMTRRLDPLDRVWELSDASVPFDFDIHAIIPSDDAPALEHELHNRFVLSRVNKVNHRKEFFRANLKEVRDALAGMGTHAEWTMSAAAAEHRETKAIEHVLATDPQARDRWIARQNVLESLDALADADSRPPSTESNQQEK
jgi:hypothetical protein